jgi:hypothetical protein
MKNQNDIRTHWTKVAKETLEGRTIVSVRYMSAKEQEDLGWSGKSVVFVLDNGTQAWLSADDEGNDGGSLFYNDPAGLFNVLPVI